MKTKELRKLNDEELTDLLKKLEMETVRASAKWNAGESKMVGFKTDSAAKSGTRTSLKRDLRRSISKIKTIQRERENEPSL